MSNFKKLLFLAVIIMSKSIFADNLDISSIGLTDLIKPATAFPSCTSHNDYWMEKTGTDYVLLTPTPYKAATIKADQITGKESGVHYASGNVIGYKEDKTLTADWLIYNQRNSHSVGGNVVLTRQYNVMQGKWIDYYFDLDKGVIKDASAKDTTTNMYATGKQINILNKKQYQVESGYFTSCNPNDPDWHIKSQEMNFDYQNGEGNARHAVFYAESTPVMYAPYFSFPLGVRKSGFLMPEFGSMNAGSFVGTPFYWNMAPNFDMTIEPKLYNLSGFLISDEFRYLTEQGAGTIYTEQLPHDWQTGEYRYYWNLMDNHSIAPDWTVGYKFSQVSDNDYFVDFGNFNTMTDNINLERSVFLHYTPNWGFFGVKLQGYQTLKPSGQPQSPSIYSTVPQIDFNVNQTPLINTRVNGGFVSQYTNFSSSVIATGGSALQNGQRFVLYPSLTLPLQNTWGHITPKFGYNDTFYQLDSFTNFQQNASSINRGIPITSVDSGLIFDRPITLSDSSYIQTIEPRLYYLYIPQISQANIPVFDTAQASPNLNQLFSENRFAGYDRINSANDITMGATSRILNDNNGKEFMNLGMGYRYYITPNNNLLYGSYTQFGQLYQPNPNFITELSNNWSNNITTNANFQYDNVYENIDAYSFQLRYNPDIHKVLNARFSYQYQLPIFYYAWSAGQGYQPLFTENQYALDVSGQWPLFSERWLLNARSNYDFTRSKFLNLLGGIEYNAGCWSVNLMYEQYLINMTQYAQAYFVQLNLGGLASVGTADPTSDLRMNIPGYVPVTVVH
jgi:LPS-assembly protein